MPTYDYVCEACGHALEIHHSIIDAPKRKCPKCKKQKLARRIGAGAGFLFKGPGFHKTDYRSESYKAGAKAETSAKSADTPQADSKTPATVEPKAVDTPKVESKPAPASKPKTPKQA